MSESTLHAKAQILVLMKGASTHMIFDPSDKITAHGGTQPDFPERVVELLTDPDGWFDLWQDGTTEAGEPTTVVQRILSRNVYSFSMVYIFPKPEDMVQS